MTESSHPDTERHVQPASEGSTPRPTPGPPPRREHVDADVAYGAEPGDAGGSEDRPSVVADVEASLAQMSDLEPEEEVEAYRDLETSLRETLRTAGEDL